VGWEISTCSTKHLPEIGYCRALKQERDRHLRERKSGNYCWQDSFSSSLEFAIPQMTHISHITSCLFTLFYTFAVIPQDSDKSSGETSNSNNIILSPF
jgi:hypothetical protein